MIKQRTIYSYDKQDFESLVKLKQYVENKIGENVIDMMDNLTNHSLTPKQKLKIFEVLTHPTAREQLNKLLNVTYEVDDYNECETKNILDL